MPSIGSIMFRIFMDVATGGLYEIVALPMTIIDLAEAVEEARTISKACESGNVNELAKKYLAPGELNQLYSLTEDDKERASNVFNDLQHTLEMQSRRERTTESRYLEKVIAKIIKDQRNKQRARNYGQQPRPYGQQSRHYGQQPRNYGQQPRNSRRQLRNIDRYRDEYNDRNEYHDYEDNDDYEGYYNFDDFY